MPNWITNKIAAPSHVIAGMLNDKGIIDFNVMAPFPGVADDWDGIYGDAETAAEIVINKPTSDHPLLSRLEHSNRASMDVTKLGDESFEQFVGMLRNFRKCGYLHRMDHARAVWGTKWNACEPQADVDAGTAEFETAWSCPKPIFVELSKRFPGDEIVVEFADEDIGSNCGSFTIKNGEFIAQDIAPSWSEMNDEQRSRWKAFSCRVKGSEPEEDED